MLFSVFLCIILISSGRTTKWNSIVNQYFTKLTVRATLVRIWGQHTHWQGMTSVETPASTVLCKPAFWRRHNTTPLPVDTCQLSRKTILSHPILSGTSRLLYPDYYFCLYGALECATGVSWRNTTWPGWFVLHFLLSLFSPFILKIGAVFIYSRVRTVGSFELCCAHPATFLCCLP